MQIKMSNNKLQNYGMADRVMINGILDRIDSRRIEFFLVASIGFGPAKLGFTEKILLANSG